ncbi:MAG: hypothetical protein ACSHX0_06645 [Akkermansiaceae bacterium]
MHALNQHLKTKLHWGVSLIMLFSMASASSQTIVKSLEELQPYLDDDHVNVQLAPGEYTVTADDVKNKKIGRLVTGKIIRPVYAIFPFEGNNSTYDFTGVTIKIKTAVFKATKISVSEIYTLGNNNVLKNLTLIDDGDVHDAPAKTAQNIRMDGANNRIEGFHVTVKGSFPYGYGDIFGKGGNKVITHRKHSACLIRGNSNHVKNCTFIQRSYGHGIFFQAANNPKVEGCRVEGELRTVADVLAEEGTGSPADKADFKTVWGYNLRELPVNYHFSLHEDGIRSYNAGETIVDGIEYDRGVTNATVIDCTVVNMRSGVTIGWDSGKKHVENCTTLACEVGYWVGGNTKVINCRGDSSVGPLYSEDVERSNSTIELTLLDNHIKKIGNTPSLYFAGSKHHFTLRDGTTAHDESIEILIGGERLGHRWLKGSDEKPLRRKAKDNTFINLTPYPITLGNNTSNNRIKSSGPVTDKGTGNQVRSSKAKNEIGL